MKIKLKVHIMHNSRDTLFLQYPTRVADTSSQEGASAVGLFNPVINFQWRLDQTGTSEPSQRKVMHLSQSVQLLINLQNHD